MTRDAVADAIRSTLSSPNVADANGEHANVVDALSDLARSVSRVGNSITPANAVNGTDAAGGSVGSLTEAVMGMTAALVQIAEALSGIAGAIRERQ